MAIDHSAPSSELNGLSDRTADQPVDPTVGLLRLGDGGPLPATGRILFHRRFEEVAAARPDLPAVTSGREELTYGELDARADRLAHRLRESGVQAEVIVGICLPRRLEAIVSILAVLKAGGAYLWLEPAHPLER